MPPISRTGDTTNTGHACTPITTMDSPILTGNATVWAQGSLIVRQMDKTIPHPFLPPTCAPHIGVVMNGSRSVIVAGMLCARIGDPCDMAPKGLITGAMTVWAGG